MKITFVLEHLFAQGAEYATSMMVAGFIEKGYDVDLIVSQYHVDNIHKGGCQPFPVPAKTNWIYLRKHKARQNILELRRYLKTSDTAAIIGMSSNYSLALRLASIGVRKRPLIVHVEHGLAGLSDDNSKIDPPGKWTFKWWQDYFYWSGFDRVLTVSDFGRSDFARVHPSYPLDRIVTVYNPVINDRFFEKRDLPTTNSWLLNKHWFTFVTAGAHEEYKGHKYLLDAMKIIRDRGEKIRVVIFGKGKLTDLYQKFILANDLEEYVSIGGYTNNFPAEAKSADAFVLPSSLESFGIVLVEALAAGLPVISTDAPFGPREILDNGKYGTLIPIKDSVKLADAMITLAHGTMHKQSNESWKRFTVKAAVERYENGLGLDLRRMLG